MEEVTEIIIFFTFFMMGILLYIQQANIPRCLSTHSRLPC